MYLAINVDGTTIFTNYIYAYPRTIVGVQYASVRILLSSCGEEDFQRFALNFLFSNRS